MPTNYGNVLPIRIPELSDQANIVTALTRFYYGLNSEGNAIDGSATTTSELLSSQYSIAGNLQRLFTNKANYTDKLSVFATTTSAELAGIISDETGTGGLVFANTPTLITPVLGVATATSINGTTIPTSKTLVTTDANQVTNTMLAGSISDSKLSTISTAGKVANSATTATSVNTASAIVARDSSGNFAAGTITANLTGNVTGNLTGTASSASTATNIAGGAAGQVVYQSASGTTAFVDSTGAASGYVLKYNGSSAPTWANPASLAAVDVAVRADNLTGGNGTTLLGSLPYQSGTNTTTLLSPNTTTAKQFLTQTGNGTNGAAPVWASILNADIPSALTGKTYNGLTLTAATTGFTIAGGTTSRTLTVGADASVSGTNTGDQTISLTGDVSATGGTGTLTTTIGALKVTNGMLAGSIENSKLLNSSITFGSTSQALGSTISNIAGVTINSTIIPTSKTLVVTTDKLSVHAATSSSELAGIISDETGTGALVFANTPTLVTPVLGAATATSINGTSIPSSKTLVTTVSTDTIAASTTGNATSATKAVAYSAASTTYTSTPANRIYVGSLAPATAEIGDIWMW